MGRGGGVQLKIEFPELTSLLKKHMEYIPRYSIEPSREIHAHRSKSILSTKTEPNGVKTSISVRSVIAYKVSLEINFDL